MGRGRQKAKQTKVARELKYRSVSTDFASLEEELRTGSDIPPAYADLAEEYSHDDDEPNENPDDDNDSEDSDKP
jgi:hypothetical protein